MCGRANRDNTAFRQTDRVSGLMSEEEFYVRYYVGHKGKFGHEFLEFEIRPDGRLRYANNSQYKNDTMIRKEGVLPWPCLLSCGLTSCVRRSPRRAGRLDRAAAHHRGERDHSVRRPPHLHSGRAVQVVVVLHPRPLVCREDDKNWPEPDRNGRQEFEVVLGNQHISFATAKIGSLLDVQESKDPEGLRIFYYLVQDLKCLAFSLIGLHFRIKPI